MSDKVHFSRGVRKTPLNRVELEDGSLRFDGCLGEVRKTVGFGMGSKIDLIAI